MATDDLRKAISDIIADRYDDIWSGDTDGATDAILTLFAERDLKVVQRPSPTPPGRRVPNIYRWFDTRQPYPGADQ